MRHQPNNIGGGILTVYLIGTAWLTARRRDRETSRFDWVVLLIPLALGTLLWMNGIKVLRSGASSQDGVPAGMMFFHGFRVFACCGGGRSHAGARRCSWSKAHRAASLAHVLWAVHRSRLFFPGTLKPPAEIAFAVGLGQHLSPAIFGTTLYLVLTLLPLILLIFWLVRVRFTTAYRKIEIRKGTRGRPYSQLQDDVISNRV